ncbi:MarR family winged helix-turn-helix transcriptional regulator [Glaciibacter superstes]|uniref:MarR family winged helix-turn-helix transcriptional regulator n=1 Tax=Glaciibacter superstes TaxID=501023 RepID=UPI0005250353|nr:MarR family transcriptional regulator [Glaciibacter superstes]
MTDMAHMDAAADVTADAATQAAITDVEEQMTVLAGHIRASIRDAAVRVDPTLQPFGLKVLRMLARCGPLQAGSLADQMMVDRSVISRQARQLEELGLIELQADPADGRARIMALTPLAKTRLHEVRVGNAALVHTRLRSWPVDDLQHFAALLARLNGSPEE